MKNWLRNKLHRFIYPQDEIKMSTVTASGDRDIDMDGSLRFNVLNCAGGVVLQLHKYDEKRDRRNNSTYIIPDGEPVAERIGQIVSMELLKS